VSTQRFQAVARAGARGRAVVHIPFDPDAVWRPKAKHHVGGTVNGWKMRGTIERGTDGWELALPAMWARGLEVAAGTTVDVEVQPEGPQRGDLPDDIAAALDADAAAGAFFDTLAQFYRKAYLRWIDGTKKRPEERARRIAELVALLAAGKKTRPPS
jgi:hypothetical protein